MLKTNVSLQFKKRRSRISQKTVGGVAVFPGYIETYRNDDVTFPFRQQSDFYYLTGFDEPGAILVMVPCKVTESHKSILFVRERDQKMEVWNGERYGIERAGKIFHVDDVYPVKEFESKLPELMHGAEKLFYRLNHDSVMDATVLRALEKNRVRERRSGRGALPIYDPTDLLGELRLFKSPEDIKSLRTAVDASVAGHLELMKKVRPGMFEYEGASIVEAEFKKQGCARLGYESIVASGKNATCLHYVANNEKMKNGDLLLVDAGGEFDYYTGDLTRTYPVGKKFSPAQAQIYSLVLKAQKAVIKKAKPGVRFSALQDTAVEVFLEGLGKLGLLKGDKKKLRTAEGIGRFYPHGVGHWLGVDVHDAGRYKVEDRSRRLAPGMVHTIEPGLYFQAWDKKCPAKFKNIGIRIEDDILITKTGNEVLSKGLPKEIEEIEAIRNS